MAESAVSSRTPSFSVGLGARDAMPPWLAKPASGSAAASVSVVPA